MREQAFNLKDLVFHQMDLVSHIRELAFNTRDLVLHQRNWCST